MIKQILVGATLSLLLIGCEGLEDSDDNKAIHNQGLNCLECHSFDSGASIFTSLHANSKSNQHSAKSHNIQLVLENGEKIIYRSARGDGNVRWNGDSGKINNFTAQVLDPSGKVVNSSKTNSHTVGRLACNTCHTQEGLNGAPGRIINSAPNISSNLKNSL